MNYIIGGGVAGLILAFYDKSYKVIDKNPLGQLNSKFQLGPRLIQKDNNTFELLKNIDDIITLPIIKTKTAKIGYEDVYGVRDNFDDEFRKRYSLITRGTEKFEQSFMSEGKSKIEHYVFKNEDNSYLFLFKTILKILRSRNQIIEDTVNYFDEKYIKIGNSHLEYDKLVNTISLKILEKITLIPSVKKYINSIDLSVAEKNFYVTKLQNYIDLDLSEQYDYIYSAKGFYTRKTYLQNKKVGKYIVFENQYNSFGEPKTSFNENEIIQKYENIPIQIMKNINVEKIENIFMLGRFAQWNHKIKLNEVLQNISRIMNG
jgi:hypothetical protein